MTNRLDSLFTVMNNEPRLLLEAKLKPAQGDRFQPTGFPDLGAAIYNRPDANNTAMLLVESAQSMANRLEAVCWNNAEGKIADALAGLPHVIVTLDNGQQTSSLQEAHRLNSPRIIHHPQINDTLIKEIGEPPLDTRKLAQSVFKLDASSVLHGVFLEKIKGTWRLQRLLSSFIEAENVQGVSSGGVKLDHVNPKKSEGESAKEGYGNVPFARTEYTAEKIIVYFNFDFAAMRGYGLGEAANRLLVGLAIYKITHLLNEGLRLRTACDFEVESISVKRPRGLQIDDFAEMKDEATRLLPELIKACAFENPVTHLQATIAPKKIKDKNKPVPVAAPTEAGDDATNEQNAGELS